MSIVALHPTAMNIGDIRAIQRRTGLLVVVNNDGTGAVLVSEAAYRRRHELLRGALRSFRGADASTSNAFPDGVA